MIHKILVAGCLLLSTARVGLAAIRFELPDITTTATNAVGAAGFIDVVVRADASDLPAQVSAWNTDFHVSSASVTLGAPQSAPNPLMAGAVLNVSPNGQYSRAAKNIFPSSVPLVDGAGIVRVPFQLPPATSGVFALSFGTINQLATPDATALPLDLSDLGSITVTLVPAALGDYDQDGDADGADVMVWQQTLSSTSLLAADGNDDKQINAPDLTVWEAHVPTLAAVAAAIPEPASGMLGVAGVVALIIRRRRR